MSLSKKSNISFYVDCLIVEAILADGFVKKSEQGSFISDIGSKITSYFESFYDKENKLKSFIDILGPAALGGALKRLFGWWGYLVPLAMEVFNISISDILSSLCDKFKSLIGSGDRQITPQESDAIVESTVKEHAPPMTPEEQAIAAEKLKLPVKSSSKIRDAQLLKVAMMEYKSTGLIALGFDLGLGKNRIVGILISVLGWFFRTGLIAVGIMVASDMIKKFVLDKPSHIDGNQHAGKPDGPVIAPYTGPVSSQTQFPLLLKSEPQRNTKESVWMEPINANESAISNMLVQFTKEVYSGLDGLESKIKNTPGFKSILSEILFENRDHMNTNAVSIPGSFHTKRQIVDYFIDDVTK